VEAKITDTKLFRMLFQYVARFIEVAHFDVKKNMFRVRSIDPHDFCYVDVTLYPSFFEDYLVDNEWSFTIDCSKLTNIFTSLTAPEIFMKIEDGQMRLSTKENWASSFIIKWLRTDIFDLPEPNVFDYEASLNVTTKELADIIRKASAISHEITFSASNPNKVTVIATGENYSFVASPISPHFKVDVKSPANVSVIVDYLKSLRYFILKCDSAKIFIGNNKPLRVDLKYGSKGIFSFSFSHKKKEKIKKEKRESRAGTSLPRISMKTFVLYVVQLSKYPEGANPKLFEIAGLETKGNDNWRLANILTLAYKDKGKIKLTPIGEAFVSLYEKDEEKAKQFLHMIAKETIVPYRIMVEEIEKPIVLDQLHQQINNFLSKNNRYLINGQDTNTLIEIAKWCGVLKIRSRLLSFPDNQK